MKIILPFFILILALSCSKNESAVPDDDLPLENAASASPSLTYPTDNLLCVAPDITFKWSSVDDPDEDPVSYFVQVATDRSFTKIAEEHTLNSTSIALSLPLGKAFYWRVAAKDDFENSSPFAEAHAFYVEGTADSNHVPFKAKRAAPNDNAQIQGQHVDLIWETTDIDNDRLSYELFFGKEKDLKLVEANPTTTSYEVNLEADTIYYWRVNSSDGSSKSIGDLWSFKTE